ncbi:4-amino-4-deoxy-L-arabinose transferase [Verrucomicrobium sp. GAS474]|uniref:hypothetical protein n=1 Tax=Verrucomicrobium sp. GAS474 TaxID=1882831 RepID=UPI000879746D|nr:hypothetical protein [Verrucomicrobium sp. GAS474]SDT96009.1 4-amino-4-deoxy-L-arabinose transferase [Verrucomicrobium sp. GAS474]
MPLLLFLDRHPLLHWTLGIGLLAVAGCLTAVAFLPRARRGAAGHPLLFALVLLPALFVIRYPTFFVPVPLNTDEALFLSEAQTYLQVPHALPWRDVDGESGGPLSALLLLWPALLHLPVAVGYPAARFAGLLCEGGFILFLWLAARRIGGERTGRATALPFLLFFSLTSHVEWIHYSSEHLSLPLFGAALWLLARVGKGKTAGWEPFPLGLALGLIPFSKLQGAPLVLFLALTACALFRGRPRAALLRFLGGLLLPAAACLAFLLATGSFGDFWISYILYAVDFTQKVPWSEKLSIGLDFLFNPRLPLSVLTAVVGAAALGFLPRLSRALLLPALPALTLWAVGLLLAAVVATIAPGLSFLHYTLYLFPGFAALLAVAWRVAPRRLAAWRRGKTALLPLLLIVVPALVWSIVLALTGRDNAAVLPPPAIAWKIGEVALSLFFLGLFLPRRGAPARLCQALLLLFLVATWIDARFRHFQFLFFAAGAVLLVREWVVGGRLRRAAQLPLPFVLLLVLPLVFLLHYANHYRGTVAASLVRAGAPSPLAALLRAEARPGDRLAIWGWGPEIAVESGLPLGTREPETHIAVKPGPRQEAYRARFLGDLERNRPRFFLDSTGPANFFYSDRQRFGPETFPALDRHLAAQYRLREEIGGMRLYVRLPSAP